MKKETWKPVVGYEGLYEVSDLGRVRSLDKVITCYDGRVVRYSSKLLKQPINKKYNRPGVTLIKDKKRYNTFPYILVAEAFIGPRPEGYDVCHIDGNCFNNELSNLRFDTRSQNFIDFYRQGSKHPRGKLSIDEVLEIRRLYATGKYKQYELAKRYKVSSDNISLIVNRKTYQWLNDDGTIDESQTAVS